MLALKIILIVLTAVFFIIAMVEFNDNEDEWGLVWLTLAIEALITVILLYFKLYSILKLLLPIFTLAIFLVGTLAKSNYETEAWGFSVGVSILLALTSIGMFTNGFGLIKDSEDGPAVFKTEDSKSSTSYTGVTGPTDEGLPQRRNEQWLFMNEE